MPARLRTRLWLACLLVAGPAMAAERLPFPADVLNPPWVEGRQLEQTLDADSLAVAHDLQFRDQQPQSGINFRHQVVEDAGRAYKAVHYDHGNAVVAADVDGDGLPDLYFATQLGGNALYRNLGNGRFEDITARAGVAVADRVSVAAAFADTDNDGDPDLFVTTVNQGNLLFRNDGDGKFTNISGPAGLDHRGHASGAIFLDYDRDGLLDLFVTHVGVYTTDKIGPGGYRIGLSDGFSGQLHPDRFETSRLYHNLGGNRFADVTRSAGIEDNSWSGDAHAADLNGDGWPDIYLLNMQGHDQYFENQAGKGFKRRSRELFPVTPWGSMGIRIADFDNDGDPDIFVTDMHTDMVEELPPAREKERMPHNYPQAFLATDGRHMLGNAFFRNAGNGTFRDISAENGAETFWPWGLSSGDLNADGFEDVFITGSMNYPFRYGVNSLLLNDAGKRFVDAEYLLGVEPRRDGKTATPWFELDCSGPDRTHELCKNRAGAVEVWGALGSRSSVILDLDGDGDLDIVTNEFGSVPQVLVSDLAQRRPRLNYLAVRLEGKKSNRDGLGARVQLETDRGRYVRFADGKSGYLGFSSMPLYFGLAADEKAVRLEITWPSGVRQSLDAPIDTRKTHRIVEAGG